MSMYGAYSVRENASVGIEVTEGSRAVFWSSPRTDIPPGIVTIEENPRAGVEVTAHSQAGFHGGNKVRNNGSIGEQYRAGIRVDGTSQVFLEGGTAVTGNLGPGIWADIGSSLDILDAVLTGNTEEGILLKHISIAEIEGTTDITGNGGGPLTCDNTSLAITSLNLKGAKCANIESSAGGKPPKALSVGPDTGQIEAIMEQARKVSERFKPPR